MSNTYNKELSSSIKNSNKEFIKEQYKLDHIKNAAKVALYYAHGQTEKTDNAYEKTRADSNAAEVLNKSAVKSINLSENVVLAAKQSLQDSGSTTSNVSTAAANMQIAANAITKLASDVAALKSVAKNTANESKILHHTNNANDLIQEAARKAEEVSLVSMQATIEAAQATASTVVTNSEATLSAIKELHASTASNYNNLLQETFADNDKLTIAKKNEKLASAKHDVTKKQDEAIKSTRKQINHVSNHDLIIFDPQVVKSKNKDDKKVPISTIPEGNSYTIDFKAFNNEEDIKHYRLIVAKYDDAEAFDINIAKDLDPGTYFQFQPTPTSKKKKIYSNTFHLLDAPERASTSAGGESVTNGNNKWRKESLENDTELFFANAKQHLAVDYKGKPIDRGVPYVAYVYVVYQNTYQHTINSTVGVLSQPSEQLTLLRKLFTPEKIELHPAYFNSRNLAVSFSLPIKHYDPNAIEYRIMMLEADNVSAKEINDSIDEAVNNLEKAEYRFNVENNILQEYTSRVSELNLRYENLSNMIEVLGPDEDGEVLIHQRTEVETERNNVLKLIDGYDGHIGQFDITQKAKKTFEAAQTKEADASWEKTSDFVFDTDLMKTVSAANYYVANPIKWDIESARNKQFYSLVEYLLTRMELRQLIVEAEPTELTQLKKDYDLQLNKVELAKVNLEEIKEKLNDLKEQSKKTPKTDPSKEVMEAELKLEEDNYNTAKEQLEEAKNKLHQIEREIEVAKELQDEISPDVMTKLITKMMQASYEVGRYNEILSLLKDQVEANIKAEDKAVDEDILLIIDQIHDYQNLKDKIEKMIEKGDEPKSMLPLEPVQKFEIVPQVVLMYTEIGEDATDNYGEPLFQNQTDFMKNAIDAFELLIENDTSRKTEFDKLADKYDPEAMQKILAENNKNEKGYQAVIFSALTAARVHEAAEYKNSHSDYSNVSTLHITQ
ncbi:hypothetical protein [Ekhidna sp.]|uniref:hypothetical protein n=1 Tax=Ekhidna sp. TaxID=2608089 RepID=UPI0032980FAB